jgi:6-phosphogluconolactonase
MKDVRRRFETANAMIATLADEIVARLKAGVAEHGEASFVVSGGTTPGALFDELAKRDAPWEKVTITLSDERWSDPAQDGSNEYLVRSRLLKGKAATAKFVPMKTPDATPDEGVPKTEKAIAAIRRPFDITLLGMGDDGHTASLYPRSEELKTALDTSAPALVHAVHAKNAAKTGDRMTLTLRAILDTKWIVLLIKGAQKMKTYEAAESGSDVLEMPVRNVLGQSKVPVAVFWSP